MDTLRDKNHLEGWIWGRRESDPMGRHDLYSNAKAAQNWLLRPTANHLKVNDRAKACAQVIPIRLPNPDFFREHVLHRICPV